MSDLKLSSLHNTKYICRSMKIVQLHYQYRIKKIWFTFIEYFILEINRWLYYFYINITIYCKINCNIYFKTYGYFLYI